MIVVASRTVRVVIVDDHPALREGTAALLRREPDLEVVATVGSLSEARAVLAAQQTDVLVLDIRLQDERGLDLLADDHAAQNRPAIVVWTAYDLPQYASFAFRHGASGFVLKTAPTSELVEAIRQASAGFVRFSARPDLSAVELTPREHALLGDLVNGSSNDEIAVAMGVTTRTIESYLTRLYERFDVRSRTELAARVVREGWLDVPPQRPSRT